MKNQELNSRNIKAFIFDVGDVIHPISWEAPVKELTTLNQALTAEKYKQSLYEQGECSYILYETRKISADDFWRSFAAKLDIPATYHHKVRETFHLILGPPNPVVLDIVNKLKDKYLLFILSNSCPELEHEVYNHSYTNWFARIYLSHRWGVKKPSVHFFRILLRENHLDPHHCVFIDDKWENIESAQNIGFVTIHHSSAQNTISQLGRLIGPLPC